MPEMRDFLTQVIASTEFWAAISGAIVGGFIAFVIQRMTLRAAAAEREKESEQRRGALAHSLMFKILRIHSHLKVFNRHITESVGRAKADGFKGEAWQIIVPLANSPEKVNFSADEMALLLSLRDDDLFNRVLAMDELHNATIGVFETYSARRLALTSLFSAEMKGKIGTSEFTDEQMRFLRPKMVELNDILAAAASTCERDEKEAWDVAKRVNDLLRAKVGLKFTFTEVDGPPDSSGNKSAGGTNP